MKVEQIVTGAFQENCYVAVKNGKALVVDPGADEDLIVDAVGDAEVLAIVLTHAHLDHVGAVKALHERWDLPILLHPDDLPLYDSPGNAMPGFYPYEDKPRPVSELPEVCEAFGMQILHTPGHSPGGCSLYFPEDKIAFTGDTLFCGGVGRTDLPGGNHAQMIDSIRRQLLTLPDDTVLFPGHGPSTTVAQERAHNPYLA